MTKHYEGQKLECINAQSDFYIKGKHYEVYKDDEGLYIVGEDGIKDRFSNLISKFKEVRDAKESD